ncbi:MAG: 3-methyl-2-oxobutanoate dehydrogenase subunit VorB [Deltaproteobacteria bacterium]|nr:3-methyl-2-oxobutanoate dehydrogenase subunit VorB [Candidatus Anaeroferrophillus wilburensis]MBN2889576.1 3-methyl-2-oxobutanoate dehydrogenase subunit VorB [Deltaproteobacteria bacterium]
MPALKKVFLKGNEAIALAAINAGCHYYFGYPITPQNEIPEYMAKHLPEVGGEFLQAESEIASINMMLGAAATGVRVMTSSSGPGISLMQEGFSYFAGNELPALVVNMSRQGPGLGGINATQGDYFQAVKGGGHGDYHLIVLVPHTGQELYDLTIKGFELAEKYRCLTLLLGDAILGQIKEPIDPWKPEQVGGDPDRDWLITGAKGRPPRLIKSLYLADGEMEKHNWRLQKKYQRMAAEDVMVETRDTDDAKLVVVAFGSMARIAKTAIVRAREQGMQVGLIRPITVFPFPGEIISMISESVPRFLVCEMNTGQMVEDVRLSVSRNATVDFYGRPGGSVPTPEEIFDRIKEAYDACRQ